MVSLFVMRWIVQPLIYFVLWVTCSNGMLKTGGNLLFDVTSSLGSVHGQNGTTTPRNMEKLLEYGNYHAYYETDIPITNIFQITNLTTTVHQTISRYSRMKPVTVLLSFRNFNGLDQWILRNVNSEVNITSNFENYKGVIFTFKIESNCSKNNHLLNLNFFKILKAKTLYPLSLRTGIGLKAEAKRCPQIEPYIETADFLVLEVSLITNIRFPESYGLFSSFMDSVASKNGQTNKLDRKEESVIIPLLTLHSIGPNLTETDMQYVFLLEKFANRWATLSHKDVVLSVFNLEVLIGNKLTPDDNEPRQRSVFVSTTLERKDLPRSLTRLMSSTFNTISSTFTTLHVDYGMWEYMASNWNDSSKLNQSLNVVVELNRTIKGLQALSELVSKVASFAALLRAWNIYLTSVDLTTSLWGSKRITGISKEDADLIFDKLTTGCITSINFHEWSADDIIRSTRESCAFIYERAGQVTWVAKIFSEDETEKGRWFTVDMYLSRIQRNLNKLLEARRILLRDKPAVTVILKVHTPAPQCSSFKEKCYLSFYCNQEVLMMNHIYDALGTWSKIHKFPVTLKRAFDTNDSFGWWSVLEPNAELSEKATSVAQFVMRNHPENVTNWKTNSCVMPTTTPPEDGISFDDHYSGVTVNLTGIRDVPLTTEEMQTVLLFALHKFKTVEILASSNSDMLFGQVLSSRFTKKLEVNEIHSRKLYLQMPLTTKTSDFTSIIHAAENIADGEKGKPSVVLAGIHFSNWESIKETQQFGIHTEKFKIGLFVQNCSAVVNELASNPNSVFLLHTDYIVCDINPIPANTHYPIQFQTNMDSQLYLRNALSRFRPNLEVLFRLNSEACCGSNVEKVKTSNMMRFLNDVNQFGRGNHMPFFLRGFPPSPLEKGENQSESMSWWRIQDYSDLTDYSVYIDQEAAELRNKSQWKPKEETENNSNLNWLYYTLTIIALVVLGAIAGYQWLRLRMKSRLLSKIEVNDFLNGNSELSELPGRENHYLGIKFDMSLSLHKEDIQFVEGLLGSGNFGVVQKAVLGGLHVAVKRPHRGSSKEAFKSMLTEVKVMAYIGEHENIVNLIGCYVGEIENGMIYIVIDLCENGSLLSYLKSLRKTTGNSSNVEDGQLSFNMQLIKFSLDIATGMEYISTKNVIHGDLSARNVLLDANNTCKIGDFGLSRKLYEYQKYVKETQEPLPWRWMAYEALTQMEFTVKSDIWSFGVTLWEIFSLGEVPYPGMSWTVDFADKLRDGLKLQKPSLATDEIYVKLRGCCSLDVNLRPSFLLMREFFQECTTECYTVLN